MSSQSKSKLHLIIDGYNVAHAWPHVEAQFEFGLETVVETLVSDLREIYDACALRLTIVLDGKGGDLDVQRPFNDPDFSILYTPKSHTADAIIEQLVSKSKRPDRMQVVTRDNAIIHSIEASGAVALSPERLLEWLDADRERSQQDLEKRQKSAKNAWENRLPL